MVFVFCLWHKHTLGFMGLNVSMYARITKAVYELKKSTPYDLTLFNNEIQS